MSAPDRGSVESMRLCLAATRDVFVAWVDARVVYRRSRRISGQSERTAIATLRARTEDLQRGLGVLLEELTRREQVLARDPETWGQR